MRFGANRKMFSLDSSRKDDLDLFLEGVCFFEGVDTPPLLLSDSSLSSPWPARAAFCRRVRALIVNVEGGVFKDVNR